MGVQGLYLHNGAWLGHSWAETNFSVLCWDLGLGPPHLHLETEGMRVLKDLSLPPAQQFLQTRAFPRGAAGANKEEPDLGLQRKLLATWFPEFKKWVPLSLWHTPSPKQGKVQA